MASPVHSVPAPDEDPVEPRPRRWRFLVAITALIVAALVVPPFINIGRFRPRIAGALSRSLGRQVSIGDVELQLLPAPGLKLTRVVVDDDPAFSQEPMLRADEVTAWLRIASLWRGRLEIARLTFDSPSFNLVRRADGHWNLESLLERARRIPVAPTTRRSAGARPRFPYIEFSSGRVNLKLGVVKTVYSLSDAEFALWLERENEWHLRLSAQPIRTDANLGDTGTVTLSGTIRRGDSLSDTPLDLQFRLERSQLGQLTTLIYGRDRGWRGSLNLDATLKGTPAALDVRSTASVDDFTRYDIVDPVNVRLATTCTALFHSQAQLFANLQCSSPVNDGRVDVRGEIAGILPVRSYDFSVAARDVPASAMATLVRHMKKDLPPDVSASGSLSAQFSVRREENAEAEWAASGTAAALALRSDRLNTPLVLGDLRFGMSPGQPSSRRHNTTNATVGDIVVEPFALDLGGETPAHARASFSRAGYQIDVEGDAGLKRLLQVSQALGVAAPRFAPEGDASLDVSISGEWAGFEQPLVLGSAKIKGTSPVNGIGTPVQVNAAVVTLNPDGISVQHLEFGWSKAGVLLTGSLQLPRHCTTIETCPLTFRLHSDILDVADLNALLNPEMQKRPWYAFIETSAARNPVLARVSASGTLNIGQLRARDATFNNVNADASLAAGVLTMNNVTGTVFEGKLKGRMQADFGAAPARFDASGSLENASVAALAGPTRNRSTEGTLRTDFVISASGLSAAALSKSASGTFRFDWRGGTLAGSEDRSTPMRVGDFHGTASLRNAQFTFTDSKMNAGGRIYQVSGSATLDRHLALTLLRSDAPAYQITGTLDKPQVTPASPAQARLQ